MALPNFEGNLDHFDPRNPYAGDESTAVSFYMGVEQDTQKTNEAGRPIFVDVECIKIYNSKDNIIDRPVRETDKKRWPRAYQAWKVSGEGAPGAIGTKLEHWPVLTRAQAEELQYFKIFTVEQLAETPDSTMQSFHGFNKLRTLARSHVDLAKGEAPILKLQALLEQETATRVALEDQIAKLAKKVEQLTAKE